jgi:hypothetical protein
MVDWPNVECSPISTEFREPCDRINILWSNSVNLAMNLSWWRR